jgi:hypothetical protein
MREGTVEDIQDYVDEVRVVELWEELVLPIGVRRWWAEWLQSNRRIHVRC